MTRTSPAFGQPGLGPVPHHPGSNLNGKSRQGTGLPRWCSSRTTRNGRPGPSRASWDRTATPSCEPTRGSRPSSGPGPRSPTSSSSMRRCRTCTASRCAARSAAIPRFSVTTPIVITTSGPSGRTQRLEAYRCGAWEFLGQPLDGEALLLKLATFLQSKQQVDVLREENLLDSGTGLYNMRGPGPARPGDRRRRAAPARGAGVRRVRARGRAGRGRRAPGRGAAADVGPGRDDLPAGRSRLRRHRPAGPDRVCRHRAGDRPRRGAPAGESPGWSGRGHPDPGPRRGATFRVKAGYCAVPDFAESAVDAMELLLRATTALRDLKREAGTTTAIRAFDQVSLPYPT